MHIDFILEAFRQREASEAVIWRDRAFSFGQLLAAIERWNERLEADGIGEGQVVSLESDFSPESIALLLALVERACVVVPLTSSVASKKPRFREISQVEAAIQLGADGSLEIESGIHQVEHPLLLELRRQRHPGLVLFSSGSTGESKAVVHDFVPLLEKFKVPRHVYRTLTFLLFDHIGGVNTLFYTLSNGGCVVTVEDRSPASVCRAIEKYRVQLLPTSPTFLNLLLASEAYKPHDLSSLELVTYGTEVMAEATLKRLRQILPDVRLLQTYGLSEVGILRSKSRSSDSLWMRVGGEGFETRVVDGKLQIRAKSAMLGYLNAPSPFTEDGWLETDDLVEVDGDYIRILGRESEIINVGGEKVYPAEVEGVLGGMEGVEEVVVTGEPNAITGQLVKARVKLTTGESARDFRRRMLPYCKDKLARFKIPQRVIVVEDALHGERFKTIRREVREDPGA